MMQLSRAKPGNPASVIIYPFYRFVRYEMKTKRLFRVDPLKQIRKPKNPIWSNADLICENTEKRTIVYNVTAKNKE